MRTLIDATVQETSEENFSSLTWLNSNDAAKYLRKTVNALRIMVNRGYIRPRKFHRRLYFRKLELDRLLESSVT
jgi:hypothetical protein